MNYSHTIAILAYNNHELTHKNLKHLVEMGYGDQILLFDNGSNPTYKEISNQLSIHYHREEKNCFVNPAWNKIFKEVKSDYLTLLNNDCFILSPNYFEEILPHMHKNNIGISSCKTKNIAQFKNDDFKSRDYFSEENQPLRYYKNARRQGWLMTLNLRNYRTLEYQIPDYIKLWYGDDWIWGQFIRNHINTAVYKNRYAIHIKNSTLSSEIFFNIIKNDINNLEKYGDWYKELSPKLHKKTRMFNRYA